MTWKVEKSMYIYIGQDDDDRKENRKIRGELLGLLRLACGGGPPGQPKDGDRRIPGVSPYRNADITHLCSNTMHHFQSIATGIRISSNLWYILQSKSSLFC